MTLFERFGEGCDEIFGYAFGAGALEKHVYFSPDDLVIAMCAQA